MKNITIKLKLILLVSLAILALIVVGLTGNSGIGHVAKDTEEIGEVLLPSILGLGIINEGKTEISNIDREVPFYENDYNAQDKFSAILKSKAEAWKDIDKGWKLYEPLTKSKDEEEQWKKFTSEWDAWKKGETEFDELVQALVRNRSEEGQKALFIQLYTKFEEQRPSYDRVEQLLVNLETINHDESDLAIKEAGETVTSARIQMLTIAVIAIAIAAFFGLYLIRTITNALNTSVDAARLIAVGDLSGNIKVDSTDETGQLLLAMKTMQDSLKDIVSDVNRVTGALANGDLSQKITKDYPGVFVQTKSGINNTVDALTSIIGEIKNIVEAVALRGDFSVKMDMAGKAGYTKEVSELLNQLSSVTETALNDVLRVANALAKGDLTQTISKEYPGVFGEVNSGVNVTVANLKELVGHIIEATETINNAAKDIATGNTDLSQRTEEQASSLEETASSMEELTATVRENAESAKQANQLAIGASDVAGKGGAVVGQVVTTMDSINESSRKIVEIISVIDGIAFQTNILALNAAVEAARAGEQGRGFAVVAGEVRSLAQRSAAAAKEIKSLIGDSVDKVEEGGKLVAQAGQTMEEIVGSIKRVTDIVSEIAAASLEQSAGIEQISVAVTQMDEVTQQNASLVQESAAAAESLEEQAQNLSDSVATFKIDGTSQTTSTRHTAASAPRREVVVHRTVHDVARSHRATPSTAASKQAARKERVAAKATGTHGAPGAPTPKIANEADGEWKQF